MRKYNRGSRDKRPANTNFQEAGENTCSPSSDITRNSVSGGSLEKCDNEAQGKENYHGFHAKIEELRKETFMLNSQLRRHADKCMQLKRENKYLLDELKHLCGPDVISILEAKNPDQSPESFSSESDCQSIVSISEGDFSSDHGGDALNFSLSIETSS